MLFWFICTVLKYWCVSLFGELPSHNSVLCEICALSATKRWTSGYSEQCGVFLQPLKVTTNRAQSSTFFNLILFSPFGCYKTWFELWLQKQSKPGQSKIASKMNTDGAILAVWFLFCVCFSDTEEVPHMLVCFKPPGVGYSFKAAKSAAKSPFSFPEHIYLLLGFCGQF